MKEGIAWRREKGGGREDPWARHGDDRSSRATSLSVPTLAVTDTSQYGTRARNGLALPFAFYPVPSLHRHALLSFKHISICLNSLSLSPSTFCPRLSNIPVARRSNERQLRFTFLSNLGPGSHH